MEFCRMWLVLCVLIIGVNTSYSANNANNVCPTFKDYYTIENNTNCWYDLSAQYEAPDIIRLNGYPLAEYKVTTVDGFILSLFRIPNDNVQNPFAKKFPVFLQHGLVSTCTNFLGLGKNSLAFLLADAGYDVWLGNYRGNQYAGTHLNLTVYDEEFWNHSMDEIVMYDLPAIFRTIQDHNANPIIFIGHSLGTSLALMYSAEYPLEAQKMLKLNVMMSPAYTLAQMKSPYKLLAPYGNLILKTVRDLEMSRLASHVEPLRILARQLCLESPPLMQLCLQMYNLFYGPNTQMGPEIIPVYFNQLPGGTSIKVLNQAADMVLGHFRKYNYGPENFKYYSQLDPPIYDIKRSRVPVYIIYSTDDWATTEADAWNLYYALPKKLRYGIRKISGKNLNHIDFLFGRKVREIVYDELINLLNKTK